MCLEAAFLTALQNGDSTSVRSFLQTNESLAQQSYAGVPPLNYVLGQSSQSVEIVYEIVLELLDHGADVNSTDCNGYSPLLALIENRVSLNTKSVVRLAKLLLDRGANVDAKDKWGDTALCAVFDRDDTEGVVELVTLLLEGGRGVDTSFRFPNSRNLLHSVLRARESLTRRDMLSLLKLLLEHKADVNEKDEGGNTPLHLAALYCDGEVVRLLLDYQADVNRQNFFFGDTPLHNALLCSREDFNAGNFLLVFKTLLNKGASLSVANLRGCTPLHSALAERKKYLWKDILNLIESLLRHVIVLESRDGDTPLHLAASACNDAMVRLLLTCRDMNVNARNFLGDTPLHALICTEEECGIKDLLRVFKTLVDRGADLSARNNLGLTSLHHALTYEGEVSENLTLPLVRSLLERGTDLSFRDNDGNTLLHLAARTCNVKMVKLLLCYQPDIVSTRNKLGDTPLHSALMCPGDIWDATCLDLVQSLLEAGASFSVLNDLGCTPLHSALTRPSEMVREKAWLLVRSLLEQNNTDLNVKDKDDNSLLHLAARTGNVEMVKLLIDYQFEVNARNCFGDTPLHCAFLCHKEARSCRYYSQVVADLLLCNYRDCTPWHYALTLPNMFLWKDLLQPVREHLDHRHDLIFKDINGNTPLHLVAKVCNVEMVKLLLKYQTDIDARNRLGDSPLMEAIRCYDSDAASGVDIVELVQLFLDRGADATAANSKGCTPLHCALLGKRGAIRREYMGPLAKLLLKYQAPVNARDADGCTPLHLAAQTCLCNKEVLKLLIANQVDINAQNKLGDTPLFIAIQCYDIDQVGFIEFVHLLLALGADPSVANNKGNSPLQYVFVRRKKFLKEVFSRLVRLLVEHKANVNVRTGAIDNTLLHLAANSNTCNVEIIRLLLTSQADIDAKNELGDTPLHRALRPNPRYVNAGTRYSRVRLLLSWGANVGVQNKQGITPLHEAVTNNEMILVQYLLDHNAPVNVKDHRGNTPLAMAVRKDNEKCVTLLLLKGAEITAVNNNHETPLLLAAVAGNLDMIYSMIRLSAHHLRPQLRRSDSKSVNDQDDIF